MHTGEIQSMWSDIRPKEHGRTRQKTSLTGVIEQQLQLTNCCNCSVYLEGLTEVRTIDEIVKNVKACLGEGKTKAWYGCKVPRNATNTWDCEFLFLSNLQQLFQSERVIISLCHIQTWTVKTLIEKQRVDLGTFPMTTPKRKPHQSRPSPSVSQGTRGQWSYD